MDLPTQMTPEVARVAPLLMLLSREYLSAEEAAYARRLATELRRDDWATCVRIAGAKRSLPFVAKHVFALSLLPSDAEEYGQMKQASLFTAMRWLKLAAAQRAFLTDCVAPTGAPHVFFKGVALAPFYDQPNLRTARDIDVLVHADSVKPVVERALAAGYRVILDRNTGRMAESAQDLQAVLHYKRDAPLLSPDGVQIELHTDIWHGAGFCSTERLLAEAEVAPIQGTAYRVLPPAMLFVYLAHHHNRHLWSSLNWLADIAALRRAPGFDEATTLALADEMELRPVVEATLAFDALIRGAADTGTAENQARARECEYYCGLNLEGDVETERGLYFARIPPLEDWRLPPRLRESDVHRAWRSRLTPNIDQYNALSLPLWLHWIYPLGRAIRGGVARIDPNK